MPGHPPADAAAASATQSATTALDTLIQQHDIVFLLTDSRESRWLPTLLCRVHEKVWGNATVENKMGRLGGVSQRNEGMVVDWSDAGCDQYGAWVR
jgi:hypothetical protein